MVVGILLILDTEKIWPLGHFSDSDHGTNLMCPLSCELLDGTVLAVVGKTSPPQHSLCCFGSTSGRLSRHGSKIAPGFLTACQSLLNQRRLKNEFFFIPVQTWQLFNFN